MAIKRWLFSIGLAAALTAVGCRAAIPDAPATPPALPTSAQAGGTSIVAISPPAQQCCPKQTLPQFLGITGLFKGLGGILDRIRNRLGARWPGLEAKPEVLALADPKNLDSDNPAVAAAAGVKAEEDGAAQKAKAIAYLASVGCAGCYPGIEEAILAALDDCTEEVRFGAAKALRGSATHPCKNCCRTACCGPKVREKLQKLAYDMDEQGCYVEISDRVRRMARLALANCNCVPEKPAAQKQTLPQEGPGSEDLPPPAETPQPTVAPASVLRQPAQTTPAIGSGVAAPVTQPVSYNDVLRAYSGASATAAADAVEVAWEEWTARPGDFGSHEETITALTLARTRLLSSQGTVFPETRLARTTHDWAEASQIRFPAIARAAATLPVGGVSGIIEGQGGWRLVRVLDRRPATKPTPAITASPAAYQVPASQPTKAASGPTPAARIVTVRLPDCNCK